MFGVHFEERALVFLCAVRHAPFPVTALVRAILSAWRVETKQWYSALGMASSGAHSM